MKILHRFLMGIGSLLLLAVSLPLFAPKAVHALVSTLVTVANTTANPVPGSLRGCGNALAAFSGVRQLLF